jgi:leader peptidase (prepilin peptidase)/N-methyltransferase
MVELVAALLALILFQAEGLSFRFLFLYYFALALTAIAFIDLELMVIPDLLIWPTFILGLANAVVSPHPPLAGFRLWEGLISSGWNERLVSLSGAVAGCILGFMALWLVARFYKAWRGHEGLGSGDPPLLGLIGLYLGWQSIFPIMLMSTMIALLSVGILLGSGRLQGSLAKKPIPFGPFLSLAALIWLFYSPKLIAWYWGLLSV